jgi:trimethylamine:corrinoid methyltransferase-like protein
MLKRARQDLSLGDLAGAVAEIGAAGPGGMFIGNAETLALMKSAALLPEVAERERREVWAQRGRRDAHARALALAKAALCAPNAGALAPETDARVRAAFAGLVAGDSRPEPSWIAAAQPAQRDRRPRRRAAGR